MDEARPEKTKLFWEANDLFGPIGYRAAIFKKAVDDRAKKRSFYIIAGFLSPLEIE